MEEKQVKQRASRPKNPVSAKAHKQCNADTRATLSSAIRQPAYRDQAAWDEKKLLQLTISLRTAYTDMATHARAHMPLSAKLPREKHLRQQDAVVGQFRHL